MKKSFNAKFLIVAMAIAVVFTMAFKAQAQTAVKVFKVGDRVEMNVANDVQSEDRWIKGTVTEIIYSDDGRILSYKVMRDGEYVQQFGNLARVIRPLDDGGEANTPPEKANPPTPTADADNFGADGDCDYQKYPALGAGGRFSETLIKNALYERFGYETDTGGLSSPLAVGVTFLNIKLGGSYTNTVTVVPGRGAQRRYDGAPVNATIYQFHAKYIVCRKYKNTTRRTQYDGENVCFKAANGNWECPPNGDQHTTDLK